MKRIAAESNRALFQTEDVSSSYSPGAADDKKPVWELYENENIRTLPNHLKQFIVDQNYGDYTPIDHAVWRYVMRQSVDFLRTNAHPIYIEGLAKTGLGVEKIPSIFEMNKILEKIGWAAVSVNGFIPPAAFMDFQAHKILVIASDLRQIDHIEYTPSPDIIHEAAGHAPVIADERYSYYLWLFGEIGSKAFSSKKDFQLYEAIRKLSILKETPGVSQSEIDEAEKDVLDKQANLGEPSEMALLSRLHWWTVEYGLIGDVDNHKIYGAGLLSSIGESYRCLQPFVKKLPYTLDAVNYAFDITTEQPQLFVTPDFEHLISVLETFSESMAFKTGGAAGIKKAIASDNVATCQYSSGLQVTGTFTAVKTDGDGNPMYINTTGPSALAFEHKQLPGHDKNYHKDGFGSPVGKLANGKSLELLTDRHLEGEGLIVGKKTALTFASGVEVSGKLENITRRGNAVILMTFSDCTITYNDEILFKPEWGSYNMAVGEKIISVFSGAADKDAFEQPDIVSKMRTIKVEFTDRTKRLHRLYKMIRDFREGRDSSVDLTEVRAELKSDFPSDWLLSLEIAELLTRSGNNDALLREIIEWLKQRAHTDQQVAKVISDGLRLVGK